MSQKQSQPQNVSPIQTLYKKVQQEFGHYPTKNVECRSGKGILTHVIVTLFTPWGTFSAGGSSKRAAHTEVCRLALAE